MKFFEPSGVFFLLKMFGKNRQKVVEWLQSLSKIILFNDHRANTFVGDELITFGKSLDFLREDKFVDLAKANKFVEKSRLAKGDISIDFSYVSTSEEYRLTSYMFLDNLRKMGIDVNLTPGIWSTIWDQAKHLDKS